MAPHTRDEAEDKGRGLEVENPGVKGVHLCPGLNTTTLRLYYFRLATNFTKIAIFRYFCKIGSSR